MVDALLPGPVAEHAFWAVRIFGGWGHWNGDGYLEPASRPIAVEDVQAP
jgi:hypothetical protein